EVRYVDYDEPVQFLVKVELDYENRPDPFSEYRSGFEIRTTRRCTAIRVSTNADQVRRVRTWHFMYADMQGARPASKPPNGASVLQQVRVEGHDDSQANPQDRAEWLPPLVFGYTPFEVEKRNLIKVEGEALPAES